MKNQTTNEAASAATATHAQLSQVLAGVKQAAIEESQRKKAEAATTPTDAEVLRFEIKELERWRDEAGLRVLPPDEGIRSKPRDSRHIRAMLNILCSNRLMLGEAAALVAHEIEVRRLMLAELGEVAQ